MGVSSAFTTAALLAATATAAVPYGLAQGPRDAIVYNNANSVRLFRTHVIMGGFRFRGHYTKGAAPIFPMPAEKIASVTGPGLAAEDTAKTENWYAAFACARDGDVKATIRTMPFLRAGSPVGTAVPLVEAGEGVHDTRRRAFYNWKRKDILSGREILIISEGGQYSGRVTNIVGNNASEISLSEIGHISQGDFMLPAPPDCNKFAYLASFYFDTHEIRNIYDSGSIVKSKMINMKYPDISNGAVRRPGRSLDASGYISPLATAVILDSAAGLSTASPGDFAEYFDPDGAGHVVQTKFYRKNSTSTEPYVFDGVIVPFSYYQKFYYYNDGNISASRIGGRLNVTGWIEP